MRDYLLAVASGVILAAAYPGLDVGLLAFVALVPLFMAVGGKGPWDSFILGFVAGAFYFAGLLNWLTVPMTVYGGVPYFLALPVLLLLVLYLSIYFGIFALLYNLLVDRSPGPGWLLVPAIWTSLELARNYLLTGFPWGAMGYALHRIPWLIQVSDVTGVYGVSFFVVLVNYGLYQAINTARRGQLVEALRSPGLIAAGAAMAVVGLYGLYRMAIWQPVLPHPGSLSVAIVQGNIDQGVKWSEAYRLETVRIYQAMTKVMAKNSPDLIVWPETAAPVLFQSDPVYRPYLLSIARESGTFLLLGSPGIRISEGEIRYTNSAFLVSPDGQELGRYDKMHLVPFGEYLPLRRLFPFMTSMITGPGEFVPGKARTLFSLPRGKIAVLICYEAIFPGEVRKFVKDGADFLVNITNDAWFGRTGAPYQHQAMAVFRAVENRVYLVRAANTGVSSITDWYGRTVMATDIFTRTSISGNISMKGKASFYTTYGDLFSYLAVIWVAVTGARKLVVRAKVRPEKGELLHA